MIFLHLFTLLNSALLLLLLLLNVVLLCEGHQHEHISAMDVKLRAHLFNNLSIHTRPVINQSEPIKVCVLIFCYQILKFICCPISHIYSLILLFVWFTFYRYFNYFLIFALYDVCSHSFLQYSSYVGRESGIWYFYIFKYIFLNYISFG